MRVDREIIAVRIALSTLFNIVNDFTKNTDSIVVGHYGKRCVQDIDKK